MHHDAALAQGCDVGPPAIGAPPFVWLVPLPQGTAAQLNDCARHHAADSVAAAKPMPEAMRDQVSAILSASAIAASGPLISAYQCAPDLHARLGIDNFLGVADEQRHIGPSKLVVATTGALRIFTETIGVEPPIKNDLEVATGEAAILCSERVRYQIVADQPYVIVHAFL